MVSHMHPFGRESSIHTTIVSLNFYTLSHCYSLRHLIKHNIYNSIQLKHTSIHTKGFIYINIIFHILHDFFQLKLSFSFMRILMLILIKTPIKLLLKTNLIIISSYKPNYNNNLMKSWRKWWELTKFLLRVWSSSLEWLKILFWRLRKWIGQAFFFLSSIWTSLLSFLSSFASKFL